VLDLFRFVCDKDASSKWNTDYTTASMMLFKFHIIVIFMYTMMIWVVLWEVPYRYDRLVKSK